MLNINQSKKISSDTKFVQKISLTDNNSALKKLNTSVNGLSSNEANKRLKENGPNEIAKRQKHTKLQFLMESFFTPFTAVLIILATLSLFTNYILVPANEKDLSTVIIMLVMILISGLTSFIQNLKTSDAVDSLLNLISITTNVRRDNKVEKLATKDVVKGDIINLAAGDLVPADLRLIHTKDLFCSSSSLNGESTPVEKNAEQKPKKNSTSYLDYPNILYAGTNIVSGSATGVVFATGEHTIFGNLAKSISNNKTKKTTFDVGIKNVSKILLLMTFTIAPLVFIINGLTKGDWLNALIFAIATAVGLTPEMLPVIVTSNLVKGSVEMSKHGTIIKRMNSIQNFGSADILCTDKTGTLTQNKVILERHYNLNLKETKNTLTLAYLNSHYQTGMNNLIDQAIISAANKKINTKKIIADYQKIDEIPFDFKRRCMSVVVRNKADEMMLITKGAAEEMIACSTQVEINGQIKLIDQKIRKDLLQKVKHLNDDGLRVVMIGYKNNLASHNKFCPQDENNLTLVGFLVFLDPPKETAKEALARLKNDGITVKILTGDNKEITRNVALKVGLNIDTVYQGRDFEGKSEEEMKKMVEECDIFVKLSPELKAKIISLLKENDHTVAYMGDGINDAPAMKASDVGISVDTAVDIAKQSADIILLHKDLRILENGVRIGRQIFGNTMKYIKITLSSNFGNILSILIASSFLPFLPMLPLQLLILDLIYGTSCLAIPFDSMNKKYLEAPRKWSTKKLPKFMFFFGPISSIFDIATFAILYFIVCPDVIGVHYINASASQKLLFSTVFCTGWFIESLWTQEMVIHALRAPELPFVNQRASTIVTIATIGAAIVGTMLPFFILTAQVMNFGPIPFYYLPIVIILLIMYILLTTAIKKWYLKNEKYLI